MAVQLMRHALFPAVHEAQEGNDQGTLDDDEDADFPPQNVGEEAVGLVAEVGGRIESVLRETRGPRGAGDQEEQGEGGEKRRTTKSVTQ
jgi:hypothetical protein